MALRLRDARRAASVNACACTSADTERERVEAMASGARGRARTSRACMLRASSVSVRVSLCVCSEQQQQQLEHGSRRSDVGVGTRTRGITAAAAATSSSSRVSSSSGLSSVRLCLARIPRRRSSSSGVRCRSCSPSSELSCFPAVVVAACLAARGTAVRLTARGLVEREVACVCRRDWRRPSTRGDDVQSRASHAASQPRPSSVSSS